MENPLTLGIYLIIIITTFIILFFIGKIVFNKIKKHENKFTDNRVLNPSEYFPQEEIETLRQVLYLIVMFLLFIIFLYNVIFSGESYLIAINEVALMLYVAITHDYNSWKNKLMFFLIIPYDSLTFLLFGTSLVSIVDVIHLPILIFLMIVYYRKFKEYTESNGLGITIILLFTIIFISFNITILVEGVNPIDSLVMVSNAFTSNGYAILGTSTIGKINSLLLVWSGYIISGVGTATLAVAILTRHFNRKFEELEELIKEMKNEND